MRKLGSAKPGSRRYPMSWRIEGCLEPEWTQDEVEMVGVRKLRREAFDTALDGLPVLLIWVVTKS
jgi:hypothetical protein